MSKEKLDKKVVFNLAESEKVNLSIRLKRDGMKQSRLLRAFVCGYLAEDALLMKYVENYKAEHYTQSKAQQLVIARENKRKEKIKKQFALEDDEIENIFDLLEEENPDL